MIYLQDFVTDHPDASPNIFDTLALTYINELFEMKPRESEVDVGGMQDEGINMILEKFLNFLNSNTKYDAKKILVHMNDSWLLEE